MVMVSGRTLAGAGAIVASPAPAHVDFYSIVKELGRGERLIG
jgi:hypothetical protein